MAAMTPQMFGIEQKKIRQPRIQWGSPEAQSEAAAEAECGAARLPLLVNDVAQILRLRDAGQRLHLSSIKNIDTIQILD
jgi:hypothetical protein